MAVIFIKSIRFVLIVLLFTQVVSHAFAAQSGDLPPEVLEGRDSVNNYVVILRKDYFNAVERKRFTRSKPYRLKSGGAVDEMASRLYESAIASSPVIAAQQSKFNEADTDFRIFQYSFPGFSAQLSKDQVAFLRAQPEVLRVSLDIKTKTDHDVTIDPGGFWHLDRMDQRDLPLDDQFTYEYDGSGVHAYILDSGIYYNHDRFERRIGNGFDVVNNDDGPHDCYGHGTQVAGALGGGGDFPSGPAHNVTFHAVRMTDCEGLSDRTLNIAAIEWVHENVQFPAVVNYSYSHNTTHSLTEDFETAVQSLIDIGVSFVTSAGNGEEVEPEFFVGVDACDFTPNRMEDVITVGATNIFDTKSVF